MKRGNKLGTINKKRAGAFPCFCNENHNSKSILAKPKKGSAFPCFCNENHNSKSILAKPKKADEKYYIIISLILGLIVLGLALYFIFQEYFTSEDVSLETCRQSILLRSLKINEGGLTENLIKESFPFKCKTEVISITTGDAKVAAKMIGDAMVSCWGIYGAGKARLYGDNWVNQDLKCFACARIHFSGAASNLVSIDVGGYLSKTRYDSQQTDLAYISATSEDPDFAIQLGKVNAANAVVKISGKQDAFIIFKYAVGNKISKGYTSKPSQQYLNLNEANSNPFSECKVIETIPA